MNLSFAFISDSQAAELMKPAVRSLDDPPVPAKSAPVRLTPPRDHRFDSAPTQFISMRLRVVGPVGEKVQRPTPWPSHLTTYRWDGVYHWKQLRDIVGVGPGQDHRERHSRTIRENMMLRAFAGPIRWVRPRFFAPPTARTELESTATRDQSIASASRSRLSKA